VSKKILSIRNLSKTYHTKESETIAVKDFSIDIMEGEFVVIVGPSGCGKSTILSILSGLLKPSSGEIVYKLTKPLSIGYMLQNDHLFPWRTILKNVLLGLEIQGRTTPENIEKAKKQLETYGLGKFMHQYPYQLSGGMRQRAALIRTLAIDPDILLLDEPFSALDYQTRLAVSEDIVSILKKEKKTVIMITHDLNEAISMASRVVVLCKRPGEIRNIHEIKLSSEGESMLQKRKAPEFMDYYNRIWRELDVHVE